MDVEGTRWVQQGPLGGSTDLPIAPTTFPLVEALPGKSGFSRSA